MGDEAMVQCLLDLGANVNVGDGLNTTTPLQRAAENGYLNIVVLLVEHGADVTGLGVEGESPLDSQRESGDSDEAAIGSNSKMATDLRDSQDGTKLGHRLVKKYHKALTPTDTIPKDGRTSKWAVPQPSANPNVQSHPRPHRIPSSSQPTRVERQSQQSDGDDPTDLSSTSFMQR